MRKLANTPEERKALAKEIIRELRRQNKSSVLGDVVTGAIGGGTIGMGLGGAYGMGRHALIKNSPYTDLGTATTTNAIVGLAPGVLIGGTAGLLKNLLEHREEA